MVKRQTLLSVKKYRELWRTIIVHGLKVHATLKKENVKKLFNLKYSDNFYYSMIEIDLDFFSKIVDLELLFFSKLPVYTKIILFDRMYHCPYYLSPRGERD